MFYQNQNQSKTETKPIQNYCKTIIRPEWDGKQQIS